MWSTLADVQRQGNQKDHVLVSRHFQVHSAGTAAEGEAAPRIDGVVETGVHETAGSRLRLVRGHRHRYNGRAEHERILLASGASCCVARNQNNSARQLLDSDFDLCVVIDTEEPAVRAIEP